VLNVALQGSSESLSDDADCLYENEPLYQIYHQRTVVHDVISQNTSASNDDDDDYGQKLLLSLFYFYTTNGTFSARLHGFCPENVMKF